jgi:hypothetical protein
VQIEGREVVEVQLLELLLEVNQDIDTQFQVWISVTFAVLVASFVAGRKLTGGARFSIAVLYVCAAVILYLRYMRGAQDYIPYVFQLFVTYGAPIPSGSSSLAFDLRRALFVFGSAVTSLAVLFPTLGHGKEPTASSESSPDDDAEA